LVQAQGKARPAKIHLARNRMVTAAGLSQLPKVLGDG
jgi:hypothetical protein